MKNLYSTHPHFVRCIIPNELKQPGKYASFPLSQNNIDKANKVFTFFQLVRELV